MTHFSALIELFTNTQDSLSRNVVKTANKSLVIRNWLYGFYIKEFEQNGEERAAYGSKLLTSLAKELKAKGLKGLSTTTLKTCRQFYESYPQIGQTVSDQLILPTKTIDITKTNALMALFQRFELSWSHYQILIKIPNQEERSFYEIESVENSWTVRELERQIDSSLYERLVLSRDKDEVKKLSEKGQTITRPSDTIKNPFVLEFLGLEEKPSYSENDLETAIIDKLEHFLLELGKGFLFESRQKRFSFDEEHFKVDLVFYNRLLRCYVLIDLKIGKLTHQDLGQMQMYVNYFDRHVKIEGENPTVGIVLCKRKKDALIELTLPKDANIFASEYKLYLPSKEELKKQIEEAIDENGFNKE